MPRQLKPYKVDTVHARGRGSVDIFLNREEKTFFGMVGPTRIEAATAQECKDLVHKALREFEGLVWLRYIEISVDHWGGHYTHGRCRTAKGEVGISCFRFEVAKTLDGSWVSRPFFEDLHPEFQDKKRHDAETQPWWIRGSDEGQIDDPLLVVDGLILYSDQAWDTLGDFIQAINVIGDRIKGLVARPDLAKVLSSGSLGSKELMALSAPKETL